MYYNKIWSKMQAKKTRHIAWSFLRMVGLEPTRCCHREILSLVRLPIPPHPLIA